MRPADSVSPFPSLARSPPAGRRAIAFCLFKSWSKRRSACAGGLSAPANPISPPQIIFDASGAVQAKSGLPVQAKDVQVGPCTPPGVHVHREVVMSGEKVSCRVTRAALTLRCGEGDALLRPMCYSATCRLAPSSGP